MKGNMMPGGQPLYCGDEAVYEIGTQDRDCCLAMWLSDSPAMAGSCNACIGYSIYDKMTKAEMDGGEMDYNTGTAGYRAIHDAVPDILRHIFGSTPIRHCTLTRICCDELENRLF